MAGPILCACQRSPSTHRTQALAALWCVQNALVSRPPPGRGCRPARGTSRHGTAGEFPAVPSTRGKAISCRSRQRRAHPAVEPPCAGLGPLAAGTFWDTVGDTAALCAHAPCLRHPASERTSPAADHRHRRSIRRALCAGGTVTGYGLRQYGNRRFYSARIATAARHLRLVKQRGLSRRGPGPLHAGRHRERLPRGGDIPLFLNGVAGLGAPFWVADFPSRLVGDGEPWQKAVAVAESIVFLLQVNLEAMQKMAPAPKRMLVTGGLARLEGLCQRLADLSGLPVYRPAEHEATARGTAYLLAGFPENWPEEKPGDQFTPKPNLSLALRYKDWREEMNHVLGKH